MINCSVFILACNILSKSLMNIIGRSNRLLFLKMGMMDGVRTFEGISPVSIDFYHSIDKAGAISFLHSFEKNA